MNIFGRVAMNVDIATEWNLKCLKFPASRCLLLADIATEWNLKPCGIPWNT